MKTTTKVYKNTYGFYPCDHEAFLKLKETHRLLFRAYRDVKRFIRWDNKMPHNRNGGCPKHPPMVEKGFHKLVEKTWYGSGFVKYNRVNLYLHVLKQYQIARKPNLNSDNVMPLDLPDNLDKITELLREFYE